MKYALTPLFDADQDAPRVLAAVDAAGGHRDQQPGADRSGAAARCAPPGRRNRRPTAGGAGGPTARGQREVLAAVLGAEQRAAAALPAQTTSGSVGDGASCPGPRERGAGVGGERERALVRLGPGCAEVVAVQHRRAPVLAVGRDEQPRRGAAGVDARRRRRRSSGTAGRTATRCAGRCCGRGPDPWRCRWRAGRQSWQRAWHDASDNTPGTTVHAAHGESTSRAAGGVAADARRANLVAHVRGGARPERTAPRHARSAGDRGPARRRRRRRAPSGLRAACTTPPCGRCSSSASPACCR